MKNKLFLIFVCFSQANAIEIADIFYHSEIAPSVWPCILTFYPIFSPDWDMDIPEDFIEVKEMWIRSFKVQDLPLSKQIRLTQSLLDYLAGERKNPKPYYLNNPKRNTPYDNARDILDHFLANPEVFRYFAPKFSKEDVLFLDIGHFMKVLHMRNEKDQAEFLEYLHDHMIKNRDKTYYRRSVVCQGVFWREPEYLYLPKAFIRKIFGQALKLPHPERWFMHLDTFRALGCAWENLRSCINISLQIPWLIKLLGKLPKEHLLVFLDPFSFQRDHCLLWDIFFSGQTSKELLPEERKNIQGFVRDFIQTHGDQLIRTLQEKAEVDEVIQVLYSFKQMAHFLDSRKFRSEPFTRDHLRNLIFCERSPGQKKETFLINQKIRHTPFYTCF